MAEILGQPVIEDVLLLSLERFAFLSKAKAAEISQFEFQFLDDEAVMLEALFEAINALRTAGSISSFSSRDKASMGMNYTGWTPLSP